MLSGRRQGSEPGCLLRSSVRRGKRAGRLPSPYACRSGRWCRRPWRAANIPSPPALRRNYILVPASHAEPDRARTTTVGMRGEHEMAPMCPPCGSDDVIVATRSATEALLAKRDLPLRLAYSAGVGATAARSSARQRAARLATSGARTSCGVAMVPKTGTADRRDNGAASSRLAMIGTSQ